MFVGRLRKGAVCRVLHSDLQIKKKWHFPAAPDSCGSSVADSGGRQGRWTGWAFLGSDRLALEFGGLVALSFSRREIAVARFQHWLTASSADRRTSARLFVVLVLLYAFTGFFPPYRDADVNGRLTENLLDGEGFTFAAETIPDFLFWNLVNGDRRTPVEVTYCDADVRQLIADGQLVVDRPDYLVQPTPTEGRYGSSFFPGPAICGLPLFAAARLLVGPVGQWPLMFAVVSKLAAALFAAGSAVLIYAAARNFLSVSDAKRLTLVYALGTSVFSICSQHWMSHAPDVFFLAAGIWAFLQSSRDKRYWAAVGMLLAMAVWCRPTSAVVVIVFGLYGLWRDRAAIGWYVLAGLPLAVGLLVYHDAVFGSVLHFGELHQSESIRQITGGSDPWQTPPWVGMAGLLISPSRGLLVFSPVLLFCVWGAVLAFRRPKYAALRPLVLATVAVWAVHSVYFDWWGGWAYGYRPIVDTVPLLILLLVPVLPRLREADRPRRAFRALFFYSVGVQLVGVLIYDLSSWNARPAFEVRLPERSEPLVVLDADKARAYASEEGVVVREIQMNIDDPRFRYRLWSLTDNQILYYVTHPFESQRMRIYWSLYTTRGIARRRAETLLSVARGLRELGCSARAIPLLEKATRLAPDDERIARELRSLTPVALPPQPDDHRLQQSSNPARRASVRWLTAR